MTRSPWTPSAQRALHAARQIADRAGAATLHPLHLLQALGEEESRGAEILAEFGLPGDELSADSAAWKNADADDPAAASLIDQVKTEAQLMASLDGREAEVGTEHLLWGLVTVRSSASELLAQHRLDRRALSAVLSQRRGAAPAPLDVDFTLSPARPTPADQAEWETTAPADSPPVVRAKPPRVEPAEPPPIAPAESSPIGQVDALRVIDAASNRAREALRVLEDYTRFVLDDAHLNSLLKTMRHELAEALRPFPIDHLLAARDTLNDVGTTITTPAESRRESLDDVITAAFKRGQEAFRTLEEFGKLHGAPLASALESLRYRLYTLEKAIGNTRRNRRRLAGRCLYLLVTGSLCPRGAGQVIREALQGGVGMVQVREKSLDDRELVELGRRVREWTREAGALYIMNDRADLAVLTDADGVHLGQEDLSVREARRIVGPERLIGVSTHTIAQARQAVLDGADYLGVGPVFSSGTKEFEQLAGLDFVRRAADEITLPWFAIGGIHAGNLDAVLEAGAARVAVSGAVCRADDPAGAAAELHRLLQGAAATARAAAEDQRI